MKGKQPVYSERLPGIVAELRARCKYYREFSDYFDGPLSLDELEALLLWAEISLPKLAPLNTKFGGV